MNQIVKPALEWYRKAKDSLDITSFSLKSSTSVKAAEGTGFHGASLNDVKEELRACKEQLERVAVVLLWSFFESAVKKHFRCHTEVLHEGQKDGFDKQIVKTGLRAADRWRMEDILDSYKGKVHARTVGECKEVYKYRNWVAHALTERPKIVGPGKAAEVLSAFLDQAGIS